MTSLNVNLGERSYPINISAGQLSQAPSSLIEFCTNKVVIVTNDVIASLYLTQLEQQLGTRHVASIVIPDGEHNKTLEQYGHVMTELLAMHAARDTTLVALGGGVIGDLTGFVAATYQRGIPFIQVPTTLLAQVDSSVGGKTAVNHPLGKNMIGAFYQPKAVFIDTDTLTTLPEREFSAGMAEVIKYGVIYDAEFFDWLVANQEKLLAREPGVLAQAIFRCCEIKAEIVALDEREGGIRALLNLGHTFGHAIEAEQGYGNWLHGEAVAAGIILACKTANSELAFPASEIRRVEALMKVFNLPIDGPEDMSCADYVKHMRHDKKVLDSKIRFVLPTKIGHAVVTDDVKSETLTAILG
ncbi:3-dehydroquinate synthase [Alteromonas sp. ASW11-36]|uniref:3-dehydroquinate synthase n=1 Tax=Alteromonas arenosi TaxID=3055817 RepID=A0ABT7SZK0_9ALTE|nr:3-dehydroquinate synthase [Alteromonas sp. ASW11-36]MDM7861626.1 3-dehydroquinate synthase [Alteromonas sp. ASW11-36]